MREGIPETGMPCRKKVQMQRCQQGDLCDYRQLPLTQAQGRKDSTRGVNESVDGGSGSGRGGGGW